MVAERDGAAFSIARAVAVVSFWAVVWLAVGATLTRTIPVGFEWGALRALATIVIASVFVVWAVVGLAFDGNLHSIGGEYLYDPARNRMIAVDARAILVSLEKVYGAKRLAEEIRKAMR